MPRHGTVLIFPARLRSQSSGKNGCWHFNISYDDCRIKGWLVELVLQINMQLFSSSVSLFLVALFTHCATDSFFARSCYKLFH